MFPLRDKFLRRVAVCCVMITALHCMVTTFADAQSVALIVGLSDPNTRGDFMQTAMNGGIRGCGGSFEDVQNAIETNPQVFPGNLCEVTFYFINDVIPGSNVTCSNECAVSNALAGGHDLIIGVGFGNVFPIQAAAIANPDINFGIIDFSFYPPIPNVEAFSWREDQMGYLSGVVAGEVAKDIGKYAVGAVGGPPIPPVLKFINGFVVGLRTVCPQCSIFEVFSDSFVSLEEGEGYADLMLSLDVAVAACGGGFTGSMACRKLAANGVYVIGVDVDEYFTTFEGGNAEGAENILTSALKSTGSAVQFAIECYLYNFSECVGKDNLLTAANGGIEMAGCNEACDVYDERIQTQVDDLFKALADGAVETGVDAVGNIIETSVTILSP